MDRRKGKTVITHPTPSSFASSSLSAPFLHSILAEQICECFECESIHMGFMTMVRRVCEVTLNGDKTFSLRQQKYKVSDALKTGEATALFGLFCVRNHIVIAHSPFPC
jgi:Hexokinase